MKVNGIEVEVRGPYTEYHSPFGEATLILERRYCFWQEGEERCSCSIVQSADEKYVSGSFYPMPRGKTVRAVLRQVVGKGLCPLH